MAFSHNFKPAHKEPKRYYEELGGYAEHEVTHEGATRSAFSNLLAATCKKAGWHLVPEQPTRVRGKQVRPDGTLRDSFNLHRGYWEAKDTSDRLDVEIRKKIALGYPLSNTTFEDTNGIVSTPQEPIDFMCASSYKVMNKEFRKRLGSHHTTIFPRARSAKLRFVGHAHFIEHVGMIDWRSQTFRTSTKGANGMTALLAKQPCNDLSELPGLYKSSFIDVLFGAEYELLPQVSQRYEIDLAYGETQSLSASELVHRSAYLYKVDGRITNHYRICQHRPVQVDPDLKHRQNFFDANAYGVGYATHGLFPYRGKFHPQMVKGIMNIIGLKAGDTVLDPMMGCGTTLIESSIMGINSVGVELSPFACLIARAKLAGLKMDCSGFKNLLSMADKVFRYFDRDGKNAGTLFDRADSNGEPIVLDELEGSDARKELVQLAFLDTMGYATRRKRKTAVELFPTVLARYLAAVEEFNLARDELALVLGKSKVMCGDARSLDIPNESVHGVLFSPPYSFAIDYVANDDLQLRYLGIDPQSLSSQMVGLIGGQGRSISERIHNRVSHYFDDMDGIIGECARVMKRGACCVIVIGSNTNQTGGIRLEERMIEYATRHGMPLHKVITREIEGIRNTMREEYILIFRKG